MPSPQLENGYFSIANELVEALARVNLSPYESRILWFVMRQTYGFHKKTDWISLNQFAEGTGLQERNVRRAIKTLTARNILITDKTNPYQPLYGVQKDYGKWLDNRSVETGGSAETRSVETGSVETGSVETGGSAETRSVETGGSAETRSVETQNPVGREQENLLGTDPHKRKKKLSKENGAADAAFERAWSLYPKRAGGNSKKNAHDKWAARIHAGTEPAEIIAGIERYARFIRATGKEGTQYVKQTETFLGPGEHWKDPWRIPGEPTGTEHFLG